jgi:effector-binding domain-containing protein
MFYNQSRLIGSIKPIAPYKENKMSYQCEAVNKPAQPTFSIRTTTSVRDLAQVLGKAFSAIIGYLGELGEQPVGAPFVAYYNMDMENLDIEIGFPIARTLPSKGDIQAGAMPGGKYATCLHIGPYNEVGSAYDALTQWMQENGYEATGVAYEIYLNDPGQTSPQELQTQIMFPLKAER